MFTLVHGAAIFFLDLHRERYPALIFMPFAAIDALVMSAIMKGVFSAFKRP
jgi:hypothetical protein